jgi:hypothetical protein
MFRMTTLLKIRDHLAAALAALACAHAIGLLDLSAVLPRGVLALPGLPGQVIGAAVCGLVYAFAVTLLYRRRLVAGPLYRCGATRPAHFHEHTFKPGGQRLLEGWQYR